jgi:hypothetical protein
MKCPYHVSHVYGAWCVHVHLEVHSIVALEVELIQAHVTQKLVLRVEVVSRVCAFDLLKLDTHQVQVCRK